MKYDFWFELPIVLMSLINQEYFKDDHLIAKLINQSYKVKLFINLILI